MNNEEIELEHIRLELLHRRKENVKIIHHLRHFVDQWFCFKNGYITKGNKAAWGKIIFKEYVSEGVLKLLEKYTEDDLLRMKGKNRLIVDKEHIIPLKLIAKKLLELHSNPSIAEIETILIENVIFATITRVEDKLLSKQDMPTEYFDSGHELFNDCFARYTKAGVKLYEKKEGEFLELNPMRLQFSAR
jgi:hypothetical protein